MSRVPGGSRACGSTALAGLLLVAGGCTLQGKAPADDQPTGETWMLTVDNDSYNFDDGNYTNGVELLWVSPAGSPTARALAWLPGLGGEDAPHVALGAHHAVFTPEDLGVADPGPDERPYAGALLFDGSVLARTADRLTGWVLRLGLVGESSLAEELQKEIHPWFGAMDPEGWATQLEDEPVLNVGVVHRRRFDAGALLDLTPSLAAHAGTWFTGATAAMRLRFGPGRPRELGALPPRTGFEIHPLAGQPPAGEPPLFAFLDVECHGVLHYLPIDGTVFRDGRDAQGEPVIGKTSLGVSLGSGPWVLVLAYSMMSDAYEAQRNPGQFGSISLAWSP